MELELNSQTGVQKYLGPMTLPTPDLVYVCVALAPLDNASRDRFFILTMAELQDVCVRSHTTWMEGHSWRRPKNPETFDLRYKVEDLEKFEDNWALISRTLQKQ